MKKKTNKIYVVDYDCGAGEVVFEIDFEVFKEVAQETLDFFSWSYDKEECHVTEAVKKYAEACMRYAMQENTDSVPYIVAEFAQEGYCRVDGSCGILLTSIYYPEINDTLFDVTIKEK